MGKRITLISYMPEKELKKIDKLVSHSNVKLCKMPYGIDDEKRYEIDHLPYHITIFATKKENESQMIAIAEQLVLEKITVRVSDIEIMTGKHNSYVLCFALDDNKQLKALQGKFAKKIPTKKYKPENFKFHLTIHIDKDYKKIIDLKNKIQKNFKPFDLEFSKLALYNYPGNLIQVFG